MARQASIRPLLRQAFLLGLMMMAVGLTLSPFLMSLAQFWLCLVWITDGIVGHDFKEKWRRFVHNRAAVVLVGLYLMHALGLLYTSDFTYALKDLRVKLPLLVLPFILTGMPRLEQKRFDRLMLVYVCAVFVATWVSFSAYVRHEYNDVREISRIISHIRFCLNIVFSIAVIGYYLHRQTKQRRQGVLAFGSKFVLDRCIQCLLVVWFTYQIYIFESLSGYVILVAVVGLSAVYAFLRWCPARHWRIAASMVTAGAVVIAGILLVRRTKPLFEVEPVDFNRLEKTTALGNPYWHDTVYHPVEDGRYVGLYYCEKELRSSWARRSAMPFDGETANHESLEATLARYLTSKGLRKDEQGVMALTEEDIHNIEQGVANYNNWRHPGLRARLSVTVFELNRYRRLNDPNGGSLSQRVEFTRASFHLIRQHPWLGVGTGDVPQAFSRAYDEIGSPLNDAFRFRAHNQYLAIAVAFGCAGLALFLFAMLYPWFASRQNRHYLYMVFLCVMLLSMFPEDTLETQAGASLFAFFSALLLFGRPMPTDDGTN